MSFLLFFEFLFIPLLSFLMSPQSFFFFNSLPNLTLKQVVNEANVCSPISVLLLVQWEPFPSVSAKFL